MPVEVIVCRLHSCLSCLQVSSDVGIVPDLGSSVHQCSEAATGGADDGCTGGGREARVMRYREKRRTRLFSKKIRYEVRKLNAERRPRMKVSGHTGSFYVHAPTMQMLLSLRFSLRLCLEHAGPFCKKDRTMRDYIALTNDRDVFILCT